MEFENTDIDGHTAGFIKENLVWDNHSCMPLRAGDTQFLPELQQFRDAGVDVVSLNVGFDAVGWEITPQVLATFRGWIDEHSDEYLLVSGVSDIDKVRESKKLGIVFDIEGASALNGQLSMIRLYYDLGVRWMLMAYNRANQVGGGCQEDDPGLSSFGREVLDEMMRVGMVICCSHTGTRTALEVMEYANQPVIFSHSNPSALWPHKRNISDEMIKACAESGGVIGINGIGIFLGDNEATVENVVRHIDYVVQLVGPDHVGLGLDYVFDQQEIFDFVRDNPQVFPPEEGYADGLAMLPPSATPFIARALFSRGYTDSDVSAIMGGNHHRIAARVWK